MPLYEFVFFPVRGLDGDKLEATYASSRSARVTAYFLRLRSYVH